MNGLGVGGLGFIRGLGVWALVSSTLFGAVVSEQSHCDSCMLKLMLSSPARIQAAKSEEP